MPKKQLVKFRSTKEFAYVTRSGKSGKAQAADGIIWSSCATTFGGSKGGGMSSSKTKISTAFGRTKAAQNQIELGSNLLGAGMLLSITVAGAPIGVALALAGTAIAIRGNTVEWVTFSKPCGISDPTSFEEPTFNQFQQRQQAQFRSRGL